MNSQAAPPRDSRLRVPPLHPPFHVVLVEPEIPPNTGNVGRICAATTSPLHLVGPLGFRIDEQAVRRAGLGLQTRKANRIALTGQQSSERNRVGAEALDQNIHTQIIAGRRRSLPRRHEGRRVDQALYRVAAADRGAHR